VEFLGSYTFNRGQTITVWQGPKSYRVSRQIKAIEAFSKDSNLSDEDRETIKRGLGF